jgi:uncharacterized protein (DUF362 family)/Pyruvate/2-oxoacid:ferredoxin oxidoreductase delta subunit
VSKVVLQKCGEYRYEHIQAALNEAFASLGGIENYIRPGMKVLIKPNLVKREKPDHHVTTHPLVVAAIAAAIKKAGAHALIAESPGGIYTRAALKAIYETTGMKMAAEISGAELNEDCSVEEVFFSEGKQLNSFKVIRPVLECDAVISAAKLKTHEMMVFSGAAKNLFGIIPGLTKTEYHYRMPGPDEFANMLVDIAAFAKPVLSVIDAIWGMEGEGPCSGDPRKIGALIVSDNPYSADIAAVSVIGMEPMDVPLLRHAVSRGLTPAQPEDMSLFGESIESLRIRDFKRPANFKRTLIQHSLPAFIQKPLERSFVLRPEVIRNKCTGCGTCANVCPAHVIEMKALPSFDYKSCINCYCCHELCPKKAIRISRPVVFRVLTKLFK